MLIAGALVGAAYGAVADREEPRSEGASFAIAPPLDALAAAAAATPSLARIEGAVTRLQMREERLGHPLPMRWSALRDRYALAADLAGPDAPLAHTRLGWLSLRTDAATDPQWTTFQWLEALEASETGPHADWAHLGLADLAATRGDMLDADRHYASVSERGAVAAHAAYQRAWLSFRWSRFDDAAGYFVSCAQLGATPLRDQAVLDLARTVVGASPAEASVWFEGACGEDSACVARAQERWQQHRQTLGVEAR